MFGRTTITLDIGPNYNISHGSVATRQRCGVIFSERELTFTFAIC